VKLLTILSTVILLLTSCSPSAEEASVQAGSSGSAEQVEQQHPVANNGTGNTYVLVHGASGGGWDWKTMDDLLRAKGHQVYRPTLTGLGEKVHLSNPDIDLTTHITDIVNVILFENLQDVVLVGHSYGGMVITGVMNEIPERIKHAIFLDAAVPEDGMSAQDLWGIVADESPHQVVDGMVYFAWLDPDAPLPRDVPQSLRTLTEPVSFNNPKALKLPATFVAYLAPGQSIDERRADPSWQNAEARGWTIQTLESDHNAQRSHPEELAALLESAPSTHMVLGKGTNLAHWLSQTRRTGEERRSFITEKDIAYIAELGFDHVRLPIDEMQMWHESGERDEDAFEIMHNAVRWSLKYDLRVLIDLHILRSHHFNAEDKPLWTEVEAQDQFIDLWRDLSEALHDYPTDRVAYELMNEPVADDANDWNKLLARAFAAVRELEPGRTVVIGSNSWQSADTFDELVVPGDDNIILSYHFYEPFMLSHYRTPWTFLRDYTGPVHYPGVILTQEEFDALPEDQKEVAKDWVGRTFNKEVLTTMMEKPMRVARELGLPLYCGEYGVFDKAPSADRMRWYADMIAIFEEHGVSSANWNYKSDEFGLVGSDGQTFLDMKDVVIGD
jgi:endoglucanase